MLNLLQVELSKILKKRSIYIIWGLMIIFCFLNIKNSAIDLFAVTVYNIFGELYDSVMMEGR